MILFLTSCTMIDIDLSSDGKDTPTPDLDDTADTVDGDSPVVELDTDGGDECTTAPIALGGVVVTEACTETTTPTPIADPWTPRLVWRASTPGGNVDATKGPVLGQTDDDNGDGRIDEHDSPEIAIAGTNVYTAGYQSGADAAAEWIAVVDGATGADRWSWRSTSEGVSGFAFGDVDGVDGAELVVDGTSAVVAYAADGTPLWSVSRPRGGWPTEAVALADVYGDGTLDVVVAGAILDGATGATLLELPAGGYPNTSGLRVLDIDQDGVNEVIRGADILGLDGSITRLGAPSAIVAWTVPVQGDADDAAELAVLAEEELQVFDDDGTELVHAAYPAGRYGDGMRPCAADLDLDGRTDMIVSTSDAIPLAYATAYSADGVELWDLTLDPMSLAGGCSIADLDADGAVEVLVQSAGGLRVVDGATGALRMQITDSTAAVQFADAPAIADIDGDGAAELILAENDDASDGTTHTGVAVFEHDGAGWAPAATVWGWMSWTDGDADATLSDGGTQATWRSPGVYRGYGPAETTSVERPLLELVEVGICADTCNEGHASFSVQVSNPSTVDTVATLEVWAGTTLLQSTALGTVPAGRSLDSITYDVAVLDEALTVVVRTDGACGGAEVSLVIPALCGS